MKTVKHAISTTVSALMVSLLVAQVAIAQNAPTIGTMARNTARSADGVNDLLMTLAYVIGGGLVFFGIMKIKAWTDNAQQNPIWKGLVWILLGGVMVAYPTMQDSSQQTVFDGTNVKKAQIYKGY